jgi:hypothetical protein
LIFPIASKTGCARAGVCATRISFILLAFMFGDGWRHTRNAMS